MTWSHFRRIKSNPGRAPILRHESRNKGMKHSWKNFHAWRGNRTRSSRLKIQCSNHWAKESTPWRSCQRLNIYLEAMRNLLGRNRIKCLELSFSESYACSGFFFFFFFFHRGWRCSKFIRIALVVFANSQKGAILLNIKETRLMEISNVFWRLLVVSW